jgi:hypothetical protein
MNFAILLNIVLLPRLLFLIRTDDGSLWKVIASSILQLVLLFVFFEFNGLLLFLAVLVLIINFIGLNLETQFRDPSVIRGIEFIIYLILMGFFGSNYFGLNINYGFISGMVSSADYFVPLEVAPKFELEIIAVIITGLLLAANEVNYLIRILFNIFGLLKKDDSADSVQEDELNAGRIIGIIERLIIFLFVLMGEFSAIGLILVAKGIARFDELKDRKFAEYFLIGTLFSFLIAIAVAVVVKRLV